MTAPRVLAETRLSLSQAAARLGVSLPTVRRWAAEGLKAADGAVVKLETAKVGRRVTSAEACERFAARLNPGAVVPARTPTERRRASAAASARLAAAGW